MYYKKERNKRSCELVTMKETITVTMGRFNNLIDAHETLMMIAELDPVKNSAEDYRDAICAILEMRGWR